MHTYYGHSSSLIFHSPLVILDVLLTEALISFSMGGVLFVWMIEEVLNTEEYLLDSEGRAPVFLLIEDGHAYSPRRVFRSFPEFFQRIQSKITSIFWNAPEPEQAPEIWSYLATVLYIYQYPPVICEYQGGTIPSYEGILRVSKGINTSTKSTKRYEHI